MKTGRTIRAIGMAVFAGLLAALPSGALGEGAPEARAVEFIPDGHIDGELRDAGRLVRLDSIGVMHVTSTGQVIEVDPTSVQGSQPQFVSTHTDADFTGGSYIAQAGFAENEYAAATYNIPNSLFPIRIDLAEMIFVTSAANQPTTTQWGIQIWDGVPTDGQSALIASYDSINDFLPPIQLPPGTNGVNVLFQVDPNDPEQIIILKDPNLGPNDDHQVTLAYGVLDHNNQTQNPCVSPPPNCCNAFPATDVSGLAVSTLNWVKAVDCGPPLFGCPSNGWFRFSQIGSICRPSGDWVMRLTWSSFNEPCLGDANGDQIVNVDDLNVVLANWFTPQISGTNGDLNGNGFVTVDDLNIVLSNFSHNCS
ncbi:MAG: hypothetical protein R3B46_08050 [Phycisphaerales bacterium]